MHLSHLYIENFRIFGSQKSNRHLDVAFNSGLNVLVGENDSGKSAVIDAIRIVLRTSSFDYYRLTEDDFHVSQNANEDAPRAHDFIIRCTFSNLGTEATGRYLEWLSTDDNGEPVLVVTLKAERLTDDDLNRARRNRFPYRIYSGKNADGPRIEGDIREFLRVTYLKPLRDAEAELAPGKGSRLSQILASHPKFLDQSMSDYDPDGSDEQVPESLVGIFRQAEHRVEKNVVVQDTKRDLNDQYLGELSLSDDSLRAGIGVTRETSLRQVLEKLELWLEPTTGTGVRTRRGLGFNNALFMAAELLLLGESGTDSLPMLLIEEPEAHLHPQMQLRIMSFFEQKSQPQEKESSETTQTFLTTHSPNLASKAKLDSMILMHEGKAYPLDREHTKLDPTDYRFLERFLDVTKANLFFAKGVMMVEGDAENILLPVIAELVGRSFSKHGISVVNVGHTGFFRYARILQSSDQSQEVPIRVACLADRDIVPDSAKDYVAQRIDSKGHTVPTYESQFEEGEIKKKIEAKKKADGGNVKTFISPKWTLEYDFAISGLAEELHAAVKIAKKEKYQDETHGETASEEVWKKCLEDSRKEILEWRADGKSEEEISALIYKALYKGTASKAVVAQFLAQILIDQKPPASELTKKLPAYIREAIEHLTGPHLLAEHHAS